MLWNYTSETLYIRPTHSAGSGGGFLGDASVRPECCLTKTRWAGEENGKCSGQGEQHMQSSVTGEQGNWLEPRDGRGERHEVREAGP